MNLVLVPGIFGFERLGQLQYFNGVAAHLEKTFPDVHAAAMNTDPFGTVPDRAEVLAAEIVRAFGSTEDVHIIAHSMGGLDARFLVSLDLANMRERVRTIVTVGTPHSGSPVATAIEKVNSLDSLTDLLRLHGSFIDELRSKVNAVKDLSEAGAAALNKRCIDVPQIRYFEIAGVGRDQLFHTAKLYVPTFLFVYSAAGLNDGVVAVASARRQRPLFASWAGDHSDLIGHDLDAPTPFSPPQFNYLLGYEDIIRRCILGQSRHV